MGNPRTISMFPSIRAQRTVLTNALAAAAIALLLLLTIVNVPLAAMAQTPPSGTTALQQVSPFITVGFLQKATLDSGDLLSGGTMIVNGFTVFVPRNSVVRMPGTFLTWSELFSLAPKPWGPTQTGLALSDSPHPVTTYEITVQGNRVIANGTDQYIAALIWVSQQSTNTGQGFINSIDYKTGELRIGNTPGDVNGARVILNDPLGRFGRVNSPDIRFTVDENNPTVRAATGYPMCVPRLDFNAHGESGGSDDRRGSHPRGTSGGITDDPLCPQSNRPMDSSGNYLQIFTLPAPPCAAFAALADGSPSVTPPNCVLNAPPGSPDATEQMPFEVGDYVTYSGTLVRDASSEECRRDRSHDGRSCEYISAWSVVADVAAFTAPGVMPTYVGVDVTLMGAGGFPAPTFPQEATARVKAIGFTTDPSNVVDIYGVDINPCTGVTKDRYFGTQFIEQTAKKGRFQFQPSGGVFLPPVRQLRVVSRTLSAGAIPAKFDPTNTFANGLMAGQYVVPIMTYVFPAALEVSDPPVALNIQDFPFLASGSGPWQSFANTALPAGPPAAHTSLTAGQFAPDPGALVSQLTPWPGATPPSTAVCPTGPSVPPVPNAGADQTVSAGSVVQLDATSSSDPNTPPALPLTFFWTQLSGTPVTLSDPGSATPTFVAPLQPDTLTFSLAAMNTRGVVSPNPTTIKVTVTSSSALLVNAGPPQTVSAGSLVILQGGVSDSTAIVAWQQVSGPSVTLSRANTLTPSFTAPTAQILAPTDLVFSITATSATLGTASATVTITVKPQVDALLLTAVYQTSKARLNITVSSTGPAGAATITATFDGQTLPLLYNPGLNAYTALVVGIAPPKIVTATSSLGGTITRAVIVQP